MIEQRIRARVGAYSVPAVVHAVQGDTGRVFVFELEDYTVTGAEGASLNCQRPDKSFYTYAGTVSAEDNTVTVALDVEGGALTQEGVVTFQLELTEAGLIVCTFRGSIIVEPVVGGEATQEEKDFRDAIQAQLNDKASNAQLAQVESDLTESIDAVADDLAQEILDRTAADEALDATKASKSTTINGKDLSEDRVIYAQDIPSKNLLPNTASTQTINGVTFTVNDDGSITANGTASANTFLNLISANFSIPAGQYILSGCPEGGHSASSGSNDNYLLRLLDSAGESFVVDIGSSAEFTMVSGRTINAVAIRIASGYTCSNLTFRPMIRLASVEDTEYVPYAMTNIELTKLHAKTTVFQPTLSNVQSGGALFYWKSGNVVTVLFDVKMSATGDQTICVLPEGFRPIRAVGGVIPIAGGSASVTQFWAINTSGNVILTCGNTTNQLYTTIVFAV